MRRRYLALTPLLLVGCTDTLGLGGECDAEMATVRRDFGNPDDVGTGGSLDRQIWFYDARAGRDRFTYEFNWESGVCIVSGPNFYARAPAEPPRLP